jgi:hypothetical protein
MTFNGNSLVDSLASGFGTVRRGADKLFYSIGKVDVPAPILLCEG